MMSPAHLVLRSSARSVLRNQRPALPIRRYINTHTTTIHLESLPIRKGHMRTRQSLITPALSCNFTQSSIFLKKKAPKESSAPKSNDKDAASATEDPFDFTLLHDSIKDAVKKLKDDLAKLRTGGRVTPEALENLRVALPKADSSDVGKGKKGTSSASKETVRLGDIASVIPKGGRSITVLVGEENDVKPVVSAITASDLSLNPQADQHNPLQLNVVIPPPTKESREQTVKDAKAAMEKASNVVRNGRAALNKKLKGKEMKKARPDDVRKAVDQMEKIAEKGQKEVKDVFEAAKKALEA